MNGGSKTLRIDGLTDERSLVHIVRFVDGYSVGWKFCLKEEFRDMLDIKKTNRAGVADAEQVFLQGSHYCFEAGHLIYDCREAYEEQWKDAMRTIRYAVQIISALPAGFVKTKDYRTATAVTYVEDGKSVSEPAVIEYTRRRMGYGSVEIRLLKNAGGSTLSEIGRFKTDQEKFVSFLQTGVLRDFSGAVVSSECSPAS